MIDIFQQIQIGKNRREARSAKNKANDAVEESREFRSELITKVDQLSVICQALWEMMQDLHGTTEEELIKKVQEIDLRDGKLDGKYVKEVNKCSECARAMNPRHLKCIYCGSPRLSRSAFEQV